MRARYASGSFGTLSIWPSTSTFFVVAPLCDRTTEILTIYNNLSTPDNTTETVILTAEMCYDWFKEYIT